MDTITIRLLVTTLFGNRIARNGDQVTVSRERARTLIQRGHAELVVQVPADHTAEVKEPTLRKTRKRRKSQED